MVSGIVSRPLETFCFPPKMIKPHKTHWLGNLLLRVAGYKKNKRSQNHQGFLPKRTILFDNFCDYAIMLLMLLNKHCYWFVHRPHRIANMETNGTVAHPSRLQAAARFPWRPTRGDRFPWPAEMVFIFLGAWLGLVVGS